MEETPSEALRALSRAAFGQAYRLEVMLEIDDDEDGIVTLTTLARSLNVSASSIQAPVRSLVACGLLSELPRGDGKSKFLLKNPSPAWEWARELRAISAGPVSR